MSWVISSGCEFGVRVICCSSFFVFIDSFIVDFISFLMLAALSRIHSFLFSFMRSFTSAIMDSLRSFIMVDTWSFQFADFSESDSNVIFSWISRCVVMWGPLS